MNKGLWLARLLMRHEGMTKEDILQAWSDEDDRGRAMPQSTFYDQRRYLLDRYGIHIDYREGLYRLRRDLKAVDPLLRLLIDDGGDAEVAKDGTAPSGSLWVPLVAEAMRRSCRLQMVYAPFDKPAYPTHLSPYCLRLLRGRYYVVGASSRHGEVRNFAADRIRELGLLPMRFRRPDDFSAEAYFRHSFGAYGGPDIQPEHIVLEASARVADYLRSKPLHGTQREVPADSGRFELDVAPTCDLVGELLSYGADLCVKAPESLRRTIGEKAKRAAEMYAGGPFPEEEEKRRNVAGE
ncbi:MAG TPA: WYL domain-containing protein [Alloprevotella sp.]|nr:WYL domain-containing protein [Alloprevotella sp.]